VTPVESCTGCGMLFGFLPRGYCSDCLDARDEAFRTVREWLFDNSGASIGEASKATGVEDALIMSFIREGRLELVGSGGGGEGRPPMTEQDVKERIRREMVERTARAARAPSTPGRASGMRTRGS